MADLIRWLRDQATIDDSDGMPNAAKRGRAIADELLLLRAYRDDVANSIQHALDETCTADEKHCTCVPYLRTKVAELRATLRCVLDNGLDDYWAENNAEWVTRAQNE